jgi:hypothetical protein
MRASIYNAMPIEGVRALVEYMKEFEARQRHSAILDKYDPQKRIGLSFSEWGTWWAKEEKPPSNLYQQNTLRDAVIAGLTLNIFQSLAFTTLSLAMLELAAPGQEGEASSSLQLATILGSVLGAGIGGALIANVQSQGEPLTRALLLQDGLMIAVAAVGLVVARGLPGRARDSVPLT